MSEPAVYLYAAGGPSTDTVIEITISHDDIKELYDEAIGDYCPICDEAAIKDGEILCCECLARAIKYHGGHHNCLKEKK